MKRCLADANVFLALLAKNHRHYEGTLRWFDALEPGQAVLCRYVQLAVVRLLANKSVMGTDVVDPGTAWQLIQELCEDERVTFVPEPHQIESTMVSMLNMAQGASNIVTDAYLAAFAITGAMRITTMDRGFRQFRGLDLELLPG